MDSNKKNVVYLRPPQKANMPACGEVVKHLELLLDQAKKGEIKAVFTVGVDYRSHLVDGHAGQAQVYTEALREGLFNLASEVDHLV